MDYGKRGKMMHEYIYIPEILPLDLCKDLSDHLFQLKDKGELSHDSENYLIYYTFNSNSKIMSRDMRITWHRVVFKNAHILFFLMSQLNIKKGERHLYSRLNFFLFILLSNFLHSSLTLICILYLFSEIIFFFYFFYIF